MAFLKSMDELGEKFVFGHSNPANWLQRLGLRPFKSERASDYRLSKNRHANIDLLDFYHFCAVHPY